MPVNSGSARSSSPVSNSLAAETLPDKSGYNQQGPGGSPVEREGCMSVLFLKHSVTVGIYMYSQTCSIDHLYIKTTFLDSLGADLHVNEPVHKDHLLLETTFSVFFGRSLLTCFTVHIK